MRARLGAVLIAVTWGAVANVDAQPRPRRAPPPAPAPYAQPQPPTTRGPANRRPAPPASNPYRGGSNGNTPQPYSNSNGPQYDPYNQPNNGGYNGNAPAYDPYADPRQPPSGGHPPPPNPAPTPYGAYDPYTDPRQPPPAPPNSPYNQGNSNSPPPYSGNSNSPPPYAPNNGGYNGNSSGTGPYRGSPPPSPTYNPPSPYYPPSPTSAPPPPPTSVPQPQYTPPPQSGNSNSPPPYTGSPNNNGNNNGESPYAGGNSSSSGPAPAPAPVPQPVGTDACVADGSFGGSTYGSRSSTNVVWPQLPDAYVKLVDVTNGCGPGKPTTEERWLDTSDYLNSSTPDIINDSEKFPVNFRQACLMHDAGYSGAKTDDIKGGVTDFFDRTQSQVDDRFYAEMVEICDQQIPARATAARDNCKGYGGYHFNHGAKSRYRGVQGAGALVAWKGRPALSGSWRASWGGAWTITQNKRSVTATWTGMSAELRGEFRGTLISRDSWTTIEGFYTIYDRGVPRCQPVASTWRWEPGYPNMITVSGPGSITLRR